MTTVYSTSPKWCVECGRIVPPGIAYNENDKGEVRCDDCGTTIAAGSAMQGDEHSVRCLEHPADPWPNYNRRAFKGHDLTRSSHSFVDDKRMPDHFQILGRIELFRSEERTDLTGGY